MSDQLIQRLRLVVRGAVQGVGFRPFIYHLASELNLNGWVCNTSVGVLIEAEGLLPRLQEFLVRIAKERPSLAVIQGMELDYLGYTPCAFKVTVDED